MNHPVVSGSAYKFYSLVWIVIMLIHGSVLYFFYSYSLEVAVVDSIIHNLIFGSIVPGFWYIVTFASFTKDDLALIGTHAGAAFFTVFVWASLSAFILELIFANRPAYKQFLSDSFIWRMIIGVMYYSISVLIFYLIRYYQDMQDRVNRELELQNLLKDSELRMLKSQINPHFIFNSLNSISALTVSKPTTARDMVIKLSEFLRYSLGKDSVEMNSLKQEIENVSLYLDIEKARFGDRLIFEKEISDACGEVKVPNLILQPLFENAIKYGVYESTDQVTIRLACKTLSDELQISIINDFDPTSVTAKGEGIGLENVRKRLNLVYRRSDLLETEKKENEFQATLRIPLNTPEDE